MMHQKPPNAQPISRGVLSLPVVCACSAHRDAVFVSGYRRGSFGDVPEPAKHAFDADVLIDIRQCTLGGAISRKFARCAGLPQRDAMTTQAVR